MACTESQCFVIPHNAQHCIQEVNGRLSRIPRTPLNTKDMATEFVWVLENLFGSLNSGDWENGPKCVKAESPHECICTHSISELYFIRHIPTQQVLIVGSECVRKISTRLYASVTGHACLECGEIIKDKRKIYQRDECCDKQCWEKRMIKTGILKRCIGSGCVTLINSHPAWKTRCLNCYYLHKSAQKSSNGKWQESRKRPRDEPECAACQDSGSMYYCEDVYGPCINCSRGDHPNAQTYFSD